MIHRRKFLLSLGGAFLTATSAKAFYETFIKRPQVGYYSVLMIRFFNWYSSEFSNITNHLSKLEIEYITNVLKKTKNIQWEFNSEIFYKKLYWSARLRGDKVNYSRFTLGFDPYDQELKKLALKVVASHGIRNFSKLKKEDICGIGWDFNAKTFKIYFYTHKNFLANYLSFIKSSPSLQIIPEFSVASLKFKNKQLIEQRLCFPVHKTLPQSEIKKILNYDLTRQIMAHYSSARGVIYIPEYIRINLTYLPDPLRTYCEKISENFIMGPTTGIISQPDNMVVYFP